MAPTVDSNQKSFDQSVEADIENAIAADLAGEDEPTQDPAKPDEEAGDAKKSKKELEKEQKSSDTDDGGEQPKKEKVVAFDSLVQKVLDEQYDGDESKLEEATAVANTAVKTFNGDPIRAAKSYRNLYKEISTLKGVIKNNPFIEKLIKEAQEKGETIDENYIRNAVGTVTSNNTEQPTDVKSQQSENVDKLVEDFDLDSVTPEQLIEEGVLDKVNYENAAQLDKRDMVEKARIKYGYKVLPGLIAEQSVKQTKKKEQELSKQETIDQAKNTNKQRLIKGHNKAVSKYDVDFENNPEHAQVWDEIQQVAYSKFPDLDDDSNMLIREDAFERAMEHVFNKHNIPLQKVAGDAGENDDTGEKTKTVVPQEEEQDIIRRIMQDANSLTGKNSQASKPSGGDEEEDDDVASRVNKLVNNEIARGHSRREMISGVRKTDRKKT